MNLAATTPENTRIELIEMSNPPAMMTKVIPTAMICSIATSRVMLRRLAAVENESGFMIENLTISTSSTPPM